MYGYFYSPPPSRNRIPAELAEIELFTTGSPITPQERMLLADDVFDGIHRWEEKSQDEKEFIAAIETDLVSLGETNFESPGEADPFFGQISKSIKALRASPTVYNWQRKPAKPSINTNSEIKPPDELAEIEQFTTGGPTTPQERVLLSEDVFDGIEEWQEKCRDNEEFKASIGADLGSLAVTTFESPAEADPFYGAIKRTVMSIKVAPTTYDFQRKPARPIFKD